MSNADVWGKRFLGKGKSQRQGPKSRRLETVKGKSNRNEEVGGKGRSCRAFQAIFRN